MFGAYRRDEFADPENFIQQLGMILERYDDRIIDRVTNPLTGIQRKCKFPPSIAEIVEACDAEHRSNTYAGEYDQRSAKQLCERTDLEALDKAEPLEYRRKVIERILAEYKTGLTTEAIKPQQQPWKQYTAEELLARYPRPKQATE